MTQTHSLSINEQGVLAIGGRSTVELAQKYGTPLYVMDEQEIRRACRSYRDSIQEYYSGQGLCCYASKAFCCKAICKIVMEEGLGLDVVSQGELATAASVGFPAEKICFHGNNKTLPELRAALDYGVGRIVVDNVEELHRLSTLAVEMGKTAAVLLRIKPGVDAHTHDFVRTGQIDSKFGFALETGEAMAAVKQALAATGIVLRGIHCHIGSQIFDLEPFTHTAEVMVSFLADIKAQTGVELADLNLGGGFGIPYLPTHDPIPYSSYMEGVAAEVRAACAQKGLQLPFILIEPGRSIVGSAGLTLYTLGAVKEIPNIRTYISVDGGIGDNPRYALYQSAYQAVLANKANQPQTATVTIAGRYCESGDLLGENMPLQQPEAGDIVAVLATGAYNYAMASNYNRIARPAVVMVNNGSDRVVIKRETVEDMLRNDCL